MASAEGADKDKSSATLSEAETLRPRSESSKNDSSSGESKVSHNPISDQDLNKRLKAYRPSHKATFIGLGVVLLILAVNAGVIGFLIKKENANSKAIDQKGVSISPGTLSRLGVNDTQIGSSNEKLIVNPAADFNSGITVAGDASISGQLHLNSTLNASNANLAQLQAGNTSVSSLNINGSATASTLSVRSNLGVGGAATFQSTVTIGQLLSVDNSAAIANNLSVGNDISAANISTANLVVSSNLETTGHVITGGAAPSVSGGGALGSNGSASLSGDDEAGVVSLGTGAGAGSGEAAHVVFHTAYATAPVVVISSMGSYGQFYLYDVTGSGFYVYAIGLSPGGYQVSYIVEQ